MRNMPFCYCISYNCNCDCDIVTENDRSRKSAVDQRHQLPTINYSIILHEFHMHWSSEEVWNITVTITNNALQQTNIDQTI